MKLQLRATDSRLRTTDYGLRTLRAGFTLVEMLVVVVIIGVIMGLITSAVVKARATANAARNRTEISQLAVAVENFKTKYGFYPPSQIILCENYQEYLLPTPDPTNPFSPFKTKLHKESVEVISRMWPRINWSSPNPGPPAWQGIDWNGNGQPDAAVTLEGDQCLVFFLGGIPNNRDASAIATPSCTGFSTNPGNPAAHLSTATDVNPPFFDFSSSRLGHYPSRTLDQRTEAPPVGSGWRPHRSRSHYSYADTYSTVPPPSPTAPIFNPSLGVPYAYFSSYKAANGYNRYFVLNPSPANPFYYPYSDCPSMPPYRMDNNMPTQAVWPYAHNLTPRIDFLNSTTFQIISGGADHLFGTGTDVTLTPVPLVWTARTAATVCPSGTPGNDDQSNFSSSILGSGGE